MYSHWSHLRYKFHLEVIPNIEECPLHPFLQRKNTVYFKNVHCIRYLTLVDPRCASSHDD
jgi:hypothetical protein